MKQLSIFSGIGLLAATLVLNVAPASAQDFRATQPEITLVGEQRLTDYAQFGGRGYGGRRNYGRSYSRRGFNGGAVIGGLAAGALIGGVIASQAAPEPAYDAQVEDDGAAYCQQRFRSYDPASGSYLGNDGQRHSCP